MKVLYTLLLMLGMQSLQAQMFTQETIVDWPLVSVDFGDLNGDGFIDAVGVYDDLNFTNYIALQNDPSSGAMTEVPLFSIDQDIPEAVGLLDLNRDGLPDLITYEGNGTVNYRINTSSAEVISFGEADLQAFGALASEDFDPMMKTAVLQDGTQTVILVVNGIVHQFIEDADGLLAYVGELVSATSAFTQSIFIDLQDMNADGRIDLIVGRSGSSSSDKVVVGIQQADGTFTTTRIDNLSGLAGGTVVDYDSDGDMDIAVISDSSFDGITIYENDGLANFSTTAIISSGSYNALATTDLNDDGNMDFMLGTSFDGTAAYLYQSPGIYEETEVIANDADGIYPVDYDNDGDQDLLIAGGFASSTWLVTNALAIATTEPSLASIDVFPNPSSDGRVHFSEKVEKVQVYDLHGKLISSGEQILTMSIVNSGVYLLRGTTAAGSPFVQQVVVE